MSTAQRRSRKKNCQNVGSIWGNLGSATTGNGCE